LNLPIENPLDVKSRGIEDYCAYRPHGFAADAVGNSLAEPVGVVGEEKILRIEKVERGFEVEGSVLPAVVWNVAERSGRERQRSAGAAASGTREQEAVHTLVSSTSGSERGAGKATGAGSGEDAGGYVGDEEAAGGDVGP
jgi:hypothetical protein